MKVENAVLWLHHNISEIKKIISILVYKQHTLCV